MSALTDYYATIRSWVDDANPPDALIDSWIRIAEERINNELRVNEMIDRDYTTMEDNCVVMPPEWLEVIYVRAKGGTVFRYVTPDSYWQLQATPQVTLQVQDPNSANPWPPPGSKQVYTIIGRTLFVLPNINPDLLTQIEAGIYRRIQPMGDTVDPVVAAYPSIMLNCTLAASSTYLIEDERLSTFATLATAGIAKANDQAKAGRWSGSPLTPVVRGFG